MTMKMKYIIPFLLATFLIACGKDDKITPSKGETNWLVLEDSDDPIDHLRYRIFEEFGIPVYYNDTIGSEERESMSGTYTYYERLQVFYNPGGAITNGRFVLVKEKNNVEPVLEFLRNKMLPQIPEGFYIPSLLLVDSIYLPAVTQAYKGLNTIACAGVSDFAKMDEAEMRWWQGAVMCTILSGGLLEQESEWLEKHFYAKTLAVDSRATMYSTATRKLLVFSTSVLGQLAADKVITVEQQTLGYCGFLNYKHDPSKPERSAYTPTREEDVQQFCETIFALTAEEFEARWGEYPVVMAKYEALKEKLQEYGFVFEE